MAQKLMQEVLGDLMPYFEDEYFKVTGKHLDIYYYPASNKEIWRCVCGTENSLKNVFCSNCGVPVKELVKVLKRENLQKKRAELELVKPTLGDSHNVSTTSKVDGKSYKEETSSNKYTKSPILIVVALLIAFAVGGIGSFLLFVKRDDSSEELKAEINQLKEENENLRSQMSSIQTTVENQNDTVSSNTDEFEATVEESPSVEPSEAPTPVPTLSPRQKELELIKKIRVKFYDKKVLPVDYDVDRYSPFIELDFKVKNGTNRDIKGIKGTLYITDQFDEDVMSIDWSISIGTIKKGNTVKCTKYGIDYNQFMEDHQRLYDLSFSDLKFEYSIDQVNYTNGKSFKV